MKTAKGAPAPTPAHTAVTTRTPPPPPTPTPVPTGGLTGGRPHPTSGRDLSAVACSAVRVAGSNGSNTFTVTMDGTSLGTQTGGNGPVSIPMDTTKVANEIGRASCRERE